MLNPSQTDAGASTLGPVPITALDTPASAPGLRVDRRNTSSRAALLRRMWEEFDEMPGTSLTLAQATRLFGLPAEICDRIFVHLIAEGRLRQSGDGRFRRLSDVA